jgi:TIR domain
VQAGEVSPRARVFICYARRDENLCADLRACLDSVLWDAQPPFEVWYDRNIEAGKDWPDELHEKLATADIFVVLLSKWLLASEFVRETEYSVIEERRRRGECAVIVVQTTPLELRHTPFGRVQAPLAKPLSGYSRRDDAWPDVLRAVLKAAAAPIASKATATASDGKSRRDVADDRRLADVIPLRRRRVDSHLQSSGAKEALDRICDSLGSLPLREDPGWASFELRTITSRQALDQEIRAGSLDPWMHEQALLLRSAIQRLGDPGTPPAVRIDALSDAQRAASKLIQPSGQS